MHLELEKTDGFLFLNIFPVILKKKSILGLKTKFFFFMLLIKIQLKSMPQQRERFGVN